MNQSPEATAYLQCRKEVLDLWTFKSFHHFFKEIGLKPNPWSSVELIDTTEGYVPGNIRWN